VNEAPRDGQTLLDAVYAAPHDRDARLVYADFLQDRGDPRGELIMLQLQPPTPARKRREHELVEAHAETWIGKLTRITTWVEFELGFLARCGLAKIPKWAIGMREWTTVEHVGLSDDWDRGGLVELVTHATMKSLASLRISTRVLDGLLAARGTTPIRTLTLDGRIDAARFAALAAAPLFGALAELHVRGTIDGAGIAGSRFTRVTHELAGWDVGWSRGDDERLSVLAIQLKPKGDAEPMVKFLESLPNDVLSAVSLDTLDRKRAKRALRKQPRVVADL